MSSLTLAQKSALGATLTTGDEVEPEDALWLHQFSPHPFLFIPPPGIFRQRKTETLFFFISVFTLAHCHIPRQQKTVQCPQLIDKTCNGQSVALIDMFEPTSNLHYLYLLVFRASVLFDQLRCQYSIFTESPCGFLSFAKMALFLHLAIMIANHRGGIIWVNSGSDISFKYKVGDVESKQD